MYKREYFYFLSEKGRLYHLIDPEPFLKHRRIPSGPAFLSNTKYLDFFFTHLRRTPAASPSAASFPFVSLCGSEANYLAADDAPVVFNGIDLSCNGNIDGTLTFGGGMREPFSSEALRTRGGRLYHPVAGLSSISKTAAAPRGIGSERKGDPAPSPFVVCDRTGPAGRDTVYGLLDSALAIELGFGYMDDLSDDQFQITLHGRNMLIPCLPAVDS